MKALPIIGIIAAVVLFCSLTSFGSIVSVNNTAIRYDQTVQEQKSAINIQIQRRHDLILSLVNTVEASGRFEKSTLSEVIKMRQAAKTGNVDQAMLSINALTEAYPTLKTTEAYQQLMKELSVTENLLSEQRKTYNGAVRSYQQFVQSFPNNILLGILGYQKQNYIYLEFTTPEYSVDLFKNAK